MTGQLIVILTKELAECFKQWKRYQDNCVRSQGAYFEGDCVQCFLYLVSSINVSVFHITWLSTFWTELIHFFQTGIYWDLTRQTAGTQTLPFLQHCHSFGLISSKCQILSIQTLPSCHIVSCQQDLSKLNLNYYSILPLFTNDQNMLCLLNLNSLLIISTLLK